MVRTIVRNHIAPIADLDSFIALIQGILDTNPWGCTSYQAAGQISINRDTGASDRLSRPMAQSDNQLHIGEYASSEEEKKDHPIAGVFGNDTDLKRDVPPGQPGSTLMGEQLECVTGHEDLQILKSPVFPGPILTHHLPSPYPCHLSWLFIMNHGLLIRIPENDTPDRAVPFRYMESCHDLLVIIGNLC